MDAWPAINAISLHPSIAIGVQIQRYCLPSPDLLPLTEISSFSESTNPKRAQRYTTISEITIPNSNVKNLQRFALRGSCIMHVLSICSSPDHTPKANLRFSVPCLAMPEEREGACTCMGGYHVCAPPMGDFRRDTFRGRTAASRFRFVDHTKTSSRLNNEWWAACDADRPFSARPKSVTLLHPKRRRDDSQSQKDDSHKVQKTS